MELKLPYLGFFLIFQIIQFGIIVFLYAVISFIPELLYSTVNRFFWVKLLLGIFIHIMGWVFIYANVVRVYKEDDKLLGGARTVMYINYVVFNLCSLVYSIIYLIWGAIDIVKMPSFYIQTWHVILLFMIFIESLVIIYEFIFISYHIRRMSFYFSCKPQIQATQMVSLVYNLAKKEDAEKFLEKLYTKDQIRDLIDITNCFHKVIPKKNKNL